MLKKTNPKILVSASQFVGRAGISEAELIDYVNNGLLFPLVPLQSGVLVRRIPSLLTESIFGCFSSEEAFETFRNAPAIYQDYDYYCDELRNYSREAGLRNLFKLYSLPDVSIPWKTDLLYTSGEYVFIDPPTFGQMLTQEEGIVRRFVCPQMTRISEAEYHGNGISYLRDQFILQETSEMKICPGIGSRFGFGYQSKEGDLPVLLFPDRSCSMDYLSYLNKSFPVTVWKAVKHLDIIVKSNPYHAYGIDYDLLIDAISEALMGLNDRKKYFDSFFLISKYSDQWVPARPGYDRLTSNLSSVRFYDTQIDDIKRYQKTKTYDVSSFEDKMMDRRTIRRYCILRKFVYHLYKNINKESGTRKAIINNYFDVCLEDAINELKDDELFVMINKTSGAVRKTKTGLPSDNKEKDNEGLSVENVRIKLRKWGKGNCDAYAISTDIINKSEEKDRHDEEVAKQEAMKTHDAAGEVLDKKEKEASRKEGSNAPLTVENSLLKLLRDNKTN